VTQQSFLSAGYFTWLGHILDKPPAILERDVGFAPGSLAGGWKLLSPRFPIEASNIVLEGSTRWSGGMMSSGARITDVIAGRTDAAKAQEKVARFFDRGLDRRPAKILSNTHPTAYPNAPVGVPQFTLRRPVEWVILAQIPPGGVATRNYVAAALR
jgi:hypothetical protein